MGPPDRIPQGSAVGAAHVVVAAAALSQPDNKQVYSAGGRWSMKHSSLWRAGPRRVGCRCTSPPVYLSSAEDATCVSQAASSDAGPAREAVVRYGRGHAFVWRL